MGALAGNWGASTYAPQHRRPLSAETGNVDVYARAERAAPARVIQIPVGTKESKVIIEDNFSVPKWVASVIYSMNERWGTNQGWDTYDARPTDLDHAIKLLNYLLKILPNEVVAPVITPLADGGLQAEWHRGDKDVEFVVPYNEPGALLLF